MNERVHRNTGSRKFPRGRAKTGSSASQTRLAKTVHDLGKPTIPDLHLVGAASGTNASPSTATPRPATASTTSPIGRWRSSGRVTAPHSTPSNKKAVSTGGAPIAPSSVDSFSHSTGRAGVGASTSSRNKPSSTTSTPCCTTPRTGRSTSATSSANSRASRSTTTSGSGPRGASS